MHSMVCVLCCAVDMRSLHLSSSHAMQQMMTSIATSRLPSKTALLKLQHQRHSHSPYSASSKFSSHKSSSGKGSSRSADVHDYSVKFVHASNGVFLRDDTRPSVHYRCPYSAALEIWLIQQADAAELDAAHPPRYSSLRTTTHPTHSIIGADVKAFHQLKDSGFRYQEKFPHCIRICVDGMGKSGSSNRPYALSSADFAHHFQSIDLAYSGAKKAKLCLYEQAAHRPRVEWLKQLTYLVFGTGRYDSKKYEIRQLHFDGKQLKDVGKITQRQELFNPIPFPSSHSSAAAAASSSSPSLVSPSLISSTSTSSASSSTRSLLCDEELSASSRSSYDNEEVEEEEQEEDDDRSDSATVIQHSAAAAATAAQPNDGSQDTFFEVEEESVVAAPQFIISAAALSSTPIINSVALSSSSSFPSSPPPPSSAAAADLSTPLSSRTFSSAQVFDSTALFSGSPSPSSSASSFAVPRTLSFTFPVAFQAASFSPSRLPSTAAPATSATAAPTATVEHSEFSIMMSNMSADDHLHGGVSSHGVHTTAAASAAVSHIDSDWMLNTDSISSDTAQFMQQQFHSSERTASSAAEQHAAATSFAPFLRGLSCANSFLRTSSATAITLP